MKTTRLHTKDEVQSRPLEMLSKSALYTAVAWMFEKTVSLCDSYRSHAA